MVHLYQDGVSQADKQHTDYKERAHLITEDEGQYTCTCTVHSGLFWNGLFSDKINMVLKLLGKTTDKKTTHSSIFNQQFYLF